MNRIVALIPARGGSKGIPRKNLASLAGKPLIAWTIEAALESGAFDRVMVSTDDAEIADVSRQFGADVPFLRPAELASDGASGIAPVIHALDWLAENDTEPDFLCLLQPTSPLRTVEDILGSTQETARKGADSLVSVTAADKHPVWAMRRDENGKLGSYSGEDLAALQGRYPTRQSLPEALFENGALYIATPGVIRQTQSFYGSHLRAWVMPAERSLDIDTPMDLLVAEQLLLERNRANR